MQLNRLVQLLFTIFATASLALAQSGVGVSPPRIQVSAAPGAQLTQTIVIDNPSQVTALLVQGSLSDVLLGATGDAVFLEPGSHERSLTKWLSATPLRFTLTPNQNSEVRYTIRVPQNAKPGTYWGLIMFDSDPANAQGQSQQGIGVRVRARVAHVVYVDVGTVTKSGRITGMRYQPQVGNAPNQIRISFQNTGNGLVRMVGKVEVRNLSGQVVAIAEVPESPSFPNATHEIAAVLQKSLPPGRYVLLASLDIGENKLVGGQANIEVK
jgi:hypothetical protein